AYASSTCDTAVGCAPSTSVVTLDASGSRPAAARTRVTLASLSACATAACSLPPTRANASPADAGERFARRRRSRSRRDGRRRHTALALQRQQTAHRCVDPLLGQPPAGDR